MERHQSVQDETARYQTARYETAQQQPVTQGYPHLSRSTGRSPLALLVGLSQQRPLFFWGGIWTIALLIMGLALSALLDPGFVAPRTASLPQGTTQAPAADSTESSTTDQNASPALSQTSSPTGSSAKSATILTSTQTTVAVAPAETTPFWSLGAIALSCGAGSLLLSQALKRFSRISATETIQNWRMQSQPIPQPLHEGGSAAIKPIQPSQLMVGRHTPPSTVAIAAYQMPPVLKRSPSKNATATQTPLATQTTEPIVEAVTVVVPPDESHPLDWDDSSLVNALDIRKRRPFSSW